MESAREKRTRTLPACIRRCCGFRNDDGLAQSRVQVNLDASRAESAGENHLRDLPCILELEAVFVRLSCRFFSVPRRLRRRRHRRQCRSCRLASSSLSEPLRCGHLPSFRTRVDPIYGGDRQRAKLK